MVERKREPPSPRLAADRGSSDVGIDKPSGIEFRKPGVVHRAEGGLVTVQTHDSADVSAARALIVVRRRTGRPIPDKVLELAGTGWE